MSCSVLSLKPFWNGNTIGWSIDIPAYLPLNPCFWLRQWPTAHSHLDILGSILLRFWSCGRPIFGSMMQDSKFKRHYWAWGWAWAEVDRVWLERGSKQSWLNLLISRFKLRHHSGTVDNSSQVPLNPVIKWMTSIKRKKTSEHEYNDIQDEITQRQKIWNKIQQQIWNY
jgi:hypothetical protein